MAPPLWCGGSGTEFSPTPTPGQTTQALGSLVASRSRRLYLSEASGDSWWSLSVGDLAGNGRYLG